MIDAYTTPWTEVRDRIAGGTTIAILPFGALEEHGPQLPLGTDTIVAVHTARLLAEHFDALLLPAISYGDTWATSGYPGTVGLSPATVTAIAVDIGRAVHSFGIRQFVILNGDFGNRLPLGAAVRALEGEGIATLQLDYPGMDAAIAEVRESVQATGGMNHAEEIETSMVWAAAPETVHPERFAPEYPVFPVDFGLRPLRLHEVSVSGVFGDPTPATPEKGHLLYDAVVAASIPIIERFVAGTTA
ncbi:creatininase family protein [Galbitalea soli]|uniref:Creatininase family protein n=1 Tax=Galbitalea soli TaxID=1268042 RepID=A0A7C9TQJ6_9MICO|nr:creatininase family protein [Galbitalea soli]NEM91497.1 creatininase family protein [Galbitalea soli]NYJ30190.1 creatinine amidohydrolase [Galbitalea soli]